MKRVMLVVGLAAAALWFSHRGNDQLETLMNRVWVDKLPAGDREKVSVLVVIDDDDEPFGVFQERSAFQGDFDVFTHTIQGDALKITMLQQGAKATLRYKAVACKEREFDFCLELQGSPRGPVRYYSRKGWEVDAAADALQRVQSLLAGGT